MGRMREVGIDFLDTAPTRVSTEADIAASVEEVWAALVDNAGWVDWFEQTESITADPPIWSAAGDTRTIEVGPITVDEVAIEVTAGERWAMCLIRTNLPLAKAMIEVVDIRDTSRSGETRTELRWTMAAEPLAVLKPFWGLVQSRMSAGWLASFENLHLYLAERR